MVANVFTHREFASQVECAGGTFFDLFSKYPLQTADDESLPIPCRFVTFAGRYAEQIRREVEKTRPSLVIHDSFAVIGRIIATLLGIPRANVCAGHNVAPARFLATLSQDPRVKISPRCLRAVEVLRQSYSMTDASPFSYISSLSPHLNIYCEPPEFLDEEERHSFEPIAFYGSLPSLEEERYNGPEDRSWLGAGSVHKFKVYVSFGTVVWRYYATDALRALTYLAEAFADIHNMCTVISLGGAKVSSEALAALARRNVSVVSYLNQWKVLQEADAFLTHHGMNSTHEAIFHRVPMISYPFFWDQPMLAAKCRKLGLAIPLADSLRGQFGKDDVRAVLTKLADQRESMQISLSRACEWEKAVIANRPAVLQRIVNLIE
jgi:MGT family glycosyltransferase